MNKKLRDKLIFNYFWSGIENEQTRLAVRLLAEENIKSRQFAADYIKRIRRLIKRDK